MHGCWHCSTKAGADAYIAGYEVKYKYKLWRPVVAIPNAAELGNPAITGDPNWEPRNMNG
jgi:hypothetical protein